ncbi:ABC transporter substrate-binding protein [Candidatus Odyssella acanthamoebae]|uniref:ABC transporter substrate-binding protein n=1 Tax=Candidatus Odyssella acanthamoebae TaxID=91604 RepID=UPI00068F160D|nr:ABC transporter substrate-binding protein [Candidatus Paracaedibacter acanthamoebae]
MSKLIRYGAVLAASTFIVFKFFNPNRSHDLPIVAITQIISHKTLDTVRTGLVKGLEKQGYVDGKTVKIIYDNANGNTAISAQITKKFIALKPAVIVALSTTSAQLLMKPAQEAKIPLIFSAVTDPIAAKLVPSYTRTDDGVTGISDFMPAEPQLEMITAFVPHLKKLGVLFNPSEANSVAFLQSMEKEANARGITFVRGTVSSTAEAAEVTRSLLGKVDALFFPNDNTTMAAAASVAHIALQNQIPLFANDSESVKDGAMAAVAYDRLAMGIKTAEVVAGILSGQPTSLYPVTHNIASEIVVNTPTLDHLKMTIPAALADKVKVISGKE